MQETKWIVITGGPSAGKTKTLDQIAFRGYRMVPESARIWIDEEMSQGKTLDEVRGDYLTFQKKVFDLKIEVEDRLSPEQIYFFERGMPDSIPYFNIAGGDDSIVRKASKKRRYHKVFLLAQLPYEQDYARTEDAETAEKINSDLYDAYTSLGYDVVRVPVMSISERVDFILKELGFPSMSSDV